MKKREKELKEEDKRKDKNERNEKTEHHSFLSLGFLRLSHFLFFLLCCFLPPSLFLSLFRSNSVSSSLSLDLHLRLSSSGRKETKMYSAKRNDVSGDKLTRFSCHDTFHGFIFNCLLFLLSVSFFFLSFFLSIPLLFS